MVRRVEQFETTGRSTGLVRQGTSHRYEGALAEPLHIPHPFSDDAAWDELKQTRDQKMYLLMLECGIDLADPAALASRDGHRDSRWPSL
jgi:hypothetical protein